MAPHIAARLVTGPVRERLVTIADVDPGLVAADFADPAVAGALAEAEVLYTSWWCPPITAEVLAAAPRLRAVVHAAGSVKHHVTEACWERGLLVSSAAAANAEPVAEYTLAAILFANKRVTDIARLYREQRGAARPRPDVPRVRQLPAHGRDHRRVQDRAAGDRAAAAVRAGRAGRGPVPDR
ncbi:hypothetical protein ACFQQB_13885 [Nonomuraea rubra]|uniref:hypothetical protein n=1 Tax=Nonomuraea rubra TaxID=46180 RepID=UPI0036107047